MLGFFFNALPVLTKVVVIVNSILSFIAFYYVCKLLLNDTLKSRKDFVLALWLAYIAQLSTVYSFVAYFNDIYGQIGAIFFVVFYIYFVLYYIGNAQRYVRQYSMFAENARQGLVAP